MLSAICPRGPESCAAVPLLSRPNSPINTNVEVVVSGLNEFTLYDTCPTGRPNGGLNLVRNRTVA